MSELQRFYTDKVGYKYENLKNAPWYLAELAMHGSIEIDNHLLGKNNNFEHVKELANILQEYQLRERNPSLTPSNFEYLTLWNAVKNNSEKKITYVSELALEMKLLIAELNDIGSRSNRLEEMRSFLCDFSKDFRYSQTQKLSLSRLSA